MCRTCHSGVLWVCICYVFHFAACPDLDECAAGEHECNEHAMCNNTVGSYSCYCQSGYKGDGTNCEGRCEMSEESAELSKFPSSSTSAISNYTKWDSSHFRFMFYLVTWLKWHIRICYMVQLPMSEYIPGCKSQSKTVLPRYLHNKMNEAGYFYKTNMHALLLASSRILFMVFQKGSVCLEINMDNFQCMISYCCR